MRNLQARARKNLHENKDKKKIATFAGAALGVKAEGKTIDDSHFQLFRPKIECLLSVNTAFGGQP
jgi:hypothetical protein